MPTVHLPPFPAPAGTVLEPALAEAVSVLLAAYDKARELARPPWDFAVEIKSLRSLGLVNSDVRWMACKGYIEHAVETTPAKKDTRCFRGQGKLTITPNSCLILTAAGARLARNAFVHQALSWLRPTPPALRRVQGMVFQGLPRWDDAHRALWVGGRMVKRFKQPAHSQETILSVFEEEGWPCRIDDPLPGRPDLEPKRHLHDTINNLNRHQQERLIHFQGDGYGHGVRWEFLY